MINLNLGIIRYIKFELIAKQLNNIVNEIDNNNPIRYLDKELEYKQLEAGQCIRKGMFSEINGNYINCSHGIQGHTGYTNIIDLINSKEFIEAIAKEIYKGDRIDILCKQIDNITIEQAMAIRDGKLLEFIQNLIK